MKYKKIKNEDKMNFQIYFDLKSIQIQLSPDGRENPF